MNETIFIIMLTIPIIVCYGELAIHTLSLKREEERCEPGEVPDPDTITELTNRGLMALGLVGAAVWLLLAIAAGDSDSGLIRIIIIGLLAVGVAGAIWLYIRIRFRG